MKNQHSLIDESDQSSTMAVYGWWRSAAKYDKNLNLKLDISNISYLTPKVKVLREMERLAMMALEMLDDIRHKLLTYRSGDFWVPTGGIKKEEMDIPPVITILLVGFSGSGKSSLVNLMYSVLGRCGLLPFAQTSGSSSKHKTLFLKEHNILRSAKSGFCVYDTRGLDYEQVDQSLKEVSEWMSDGVHHNQPCLREGDSFIDEGDIETTSSLTLSSKFMTRFVNCPVVVADISELYKAFKNGDSKQLEATKALFCCPALRKCNENPFLILTHGDMLSTEERIEARVKICNYLDISEANGVYDIVCLSEYGFLADESDIVTAYALAEAVYRALLFSDRSHLPKRNYCDWGILFFSWLMCLFSAFFTFIASVFSKLGHKDHKCIF